MSLLDQLFLDTLRDLQGRSASEIGAYQARLLERLARLAAIQAPFYADRLRPLFSGGDFRDGAFRVEAWRDTPVLTRAEAIAGGAALHARELPTAASASADVVSTGASGVVFAHKLSAFSAIASICARNRMWEAHDVDLFTSCAQTAVATHVDALPPFGVKLENWNLTGRLNRGRQMDRRVAIDDQWDWLKRLRAAYLSAPTDVVEGLVEAAFNDGEKLTFGAVFTRGSDVSDEMRAQVTERFSCRVIDSYDLTEAGLLACECPAGGYHAQSEIALVEVLNSQGRRAAPGERGRIVATPLYQYAMPLVRYDTGDEAIVGESCACGRAALKLTRIFGRKRRLFDFAGGERISGTRLARAGAILGASRVNLRQTGPRALEIAYDGGDPAKESEAIAVVAGAFEAQGLVVAARRAALPERAYPDDAYVALPEVAQPEAAAIAASATSS
jgi:phenylacetate-CoA ligase